MVEGAIVLGYVGGECEGLGLPVSQAEESMATIGLTLHRLLHPKVFVVKDFIPEMHDIQFLAIEPLLVPYSCGWESGSH